MLKSTYQCEKKTTFTAKPMFRNIIFSFIHHAYCFLRNMRTIFIPNWFYKLKYHMQYLVWLDFTWKVCFIKKFSFDLIISGHNNHGVVKTSNDFEAKTFFKNGGKFRSCSSSPVSLNFKSSRLLSASYSKIHFVSAERSNA